MPHRDAPLAWVESPLQLMGAAEWAAAHGTRIAVAGRLTSQVEQTAAELTVRDALFAEQAGYYGIPWRMLRRHSHWVVGDGFSGQFRLAAAVLRPRRLTFVDDGLASIALADSLIGAREFARPGVAERPLARRLAPFAIDAIRLRAAAGAVTMFTTFDLGAARERALRDLGVSVQRHAFERLRTTRPGARPETSLPHDLVILGSARVVDGHMPREEYLRWVRDRSHGAPACYLPHRRERDDDIAAVARIPGVEIVRTDLPIELVLAGDDRAREIVTLTSSAAVTLRRVLAGTASVVREDAADDVARERSLR